MRIIAILTLAALPFATTATAGGISGFSMPHLTWPQPQDTIETPTRECTPGLVLPETAEPACAPQG